MKTRLLLSALSFVYLLTTVESQCDLSARKQDLDFPDIENLSIDSYILGVEFTIPGAKQTDYYVEFYDKIFRMGFVESHQEGEYKQYLYMTESWEAWNIEGDSCELQNVTDIPNFFKDYQTEWTYDPKNYAKRTVGPSAMFKIASDVWNDPDRKSKMAYMGQIDVLVRGKRAQFWRRCTDNSFVDYFFSADKVEGAFGNFSHSPLRVSFNGQREGPAKELTQQNYDILMFQNFIPSGIDPFQLPRGKNCKRGDSLTDQPDLPDFSDQNIFLNAEVLYQRLGSDNQVLSAYYSTLRFAIDVSIKHVSYRYSSWNTTKTKKEDASLNAPEDIIYDMNHAYTYRINYETAKCTISRDKSFLPKYYLPENGGSITLTDPYVLFPSNELSFVTTDTERGLKVNVFEAKIENYVLDESTIIKKVYVSHSYLTDNEETENTASVKNAPSQIQLQLFRTPDMKEIVTFNIFGFTTRLPSRSRLFDVSRCFKNDDDYLWLTLGFEAEKDVLSAIENKLSRLEESVIQEITLKSELNVARMPVIMTNIENSVVYVTMQILGKPPLMLDFPDTEKNKVIDVSGPDDTQGIANFDVCANNCLEERNDCWGFSLCGATCYYGSNEKKKVIDKNDCMLYRRYSNQTFMQSKELLVNNIVRQVEAEEFRVMVITDSGERKELKATIAQTADPAEDDSLFQKMGNLLNPRMRVLKSARKLKKANTIKNLGKLRYDECQTLCLDFKECETISYCLIDSDCAFTKKYGSDLTENDMQVDELCNLLTRKYSDHFVRSPGVFVSVSGGKVVNVDEEEDCARACMKETGFKCLSFDHCAGEEKAHCTLYSVQFLDKKARESVQGKTPRCGHYARKYSTAFKTRSESRVVGSRVSPIMNLTLEECAKSCIEFGKGTCYGYDFCQDKTLYSTSCTLLDSDPSRLQTVYSGICTNYLRTEPGYEPRPYSLVYAGGIAFLCFMIGAVVGAIVIFTIAYIRVNRR